MQPKPIAPHSRPLFASRWRAAQPWLGSLGLHAVILFGLGLGAHWVTQPLAPEPLVVSLPLLEAARPLPSPTPQPQTIPAPTLKAPAVKPPPPLLPAMSAAQTAATPTPVAIAVAATAPSPVAPTPVAAATSTAVLTASAPAASTVPANDPAAAPANKPLAATAPSPAPAPLIAADFKTTYLQNPKPNYPTISSRLGEAGTVTLWVAVNATGTVDDLGILRSSGFARLDAEALKAVKLWRFTPARRGEQAVADKVSVPIEFGL